MNEIQKRACAILEDMVSATSPERSKDLLTSSETNADFRRHPKNWCEGWTFDVHSGFSRALDCKLTPRFATENVRDAQGNPVQDTDKDGNALFNKKGKPQWKKFKRKYLDWTQGSAFAFKVGYTVTRTDATQAINILDARAAVPAHDDIPRAPGFVRIMLHTPSQGAGCWKEEGQISMTQDAFVRMLITGEWCEPCPDALVVGVDCRD